MKKLWAQKSVRAGAAVIFAAALCGGAPFLSLADEAPRIIYSEGTSEKYGPGYVGGWKQEADGRFWYQNWDGSYTSGNWQLIDDKWYYFDEEGYMLSDTWVDGADGKRYRLGTSGDMLVSQDITVDGMSYTIDENGEAVANAPAKSENELAAEAYAQSIVAQITNDSMTKPQKANAIYDWVRGNMTYTASGPKSDEAYSALYGFRRRSGCCYEYYAMSHYLLEAAGMPNIPVVRASDRDHYWNLVNVDGVWYHFDATPRKTGGRWCLVTTSTLRNTWGAHNFDVSAYPQTP